MLVDIMLLAIGLVWVLAASVFDIRTREVPDWLSFSLISLGLGIRLIYSLVYSEWKFFLYGLAAAGAALAVGVVFHYARIWGDGDSKLLVGLGAVFATAPFFINSQMPFFAVVFVNILIFGAVYGLVWALVLCVRNSRKVFGKFRILLASTRRIFFLLIICSLLVLALIPLMDDFVFRAMLIILAASLIGYYFLFLLMRAIEAVAMYKHIPVQRLTVGDWIGETVKVHGKVIASTKDYGLEQAQIDSLKRHKIKSVMVKEGMPFVPAFLFGLVFSLVFGNIMFLLF